jgi:carboxylate-amine ligase
MRTTFGVEEEFMLLDPHRLAPVDLGRQAVDDLGDDGAGAIAREFLCSQIEYATQICDTFADAHEALLGFRRRLGRWAADAGVVAAGTASPFHADPHPAVSTDDRYARATADIGALTDDHQINGLHVHVGIPDRDTGIHVSNALRAWLPVLLALSGNSPFWEGRDTGYDSWRAIQSRRWTTYGIPPRFDDASDYDRTVSELIGVGATSDDGMLNWNVRLSHKYPTLEVRVCDVQLDPTTSVVLATIIRALVDTTTTQERDRAPDARADAAQVDAALWHAARHGVGGTLLDPVCGRQVAASVVLDALHDRIAPMLHDGDERSAVETFLEGAVTGATLQRRAAASGIRALGALYGERLTATRMLPSGG